MRAKIDARTILDARTTLDDAQPLLIFTILTGIAYHNFNLILSDRIHVEPKLREPFTESKSIPGVTFTCSNTCTTPVRHTRDDTRKSHPILTLVCKIKSERVPLFMVLCIYNEYMRKYLRLTNDVDNEYTMYEVCTQSNRNKFTDLGII